MSKNTDAIQKKNDELAQEVRNSLEAKISGLEKALTERRANPLGELSKLTSITKVLEFDGFGLKENTSNRTTLYSKYKDIKNRYDKLIIEIKAINKDPSSVDPVFSRKVKKQIEAEQQLGRDKLEEKLTKLTEILTIEQSKRQAAEELSQGYQKEIRRLEKQLKVANDKIRSNNFGSNMRSI